MADAEPGVHVINGDAYMHLSISICVVLFHFLSGEKGETNNLIYTPKVIYDVSNVAQYTNAQCLMQSKAFALGPPDFF
jgi:hypothetical protein